MFKKFLGIALYIALIFGIALSHAHPQAINSNPVQPSGGSSNNPNVTNATGTLAIGHGGTGATTAALARTGLQSSVQPLPVGKLWGFGDSFMQGYGATNPGATSLLPLVGADISAPISNQGIGSTTVAQTTVNLFANFQFLANFPPATVIADGQNDGTTCSGASAPCGIGYLNMQDANNYWVTIPDTFRQRASVAAKTGTWAASTDTFQPSITASPGTSETTSTNASTLTFSVPSSASNKIGITYVVVPSQTGTFTVSIDGTLVIDNCSVSTTFSSAPCASNPAVAVSAFYRQEFSVTPNQTHTVVVTNTAAQPMEVTSVDWLPPLGNTSAGYLFKIGVIAAFAGTNFTLWNTIDAGLATTMRAENLPSYFVDVINGTPGVNSTSDISGTATAICPATTFFNHPNDCGYLHMYQTLVNTEIANNFYFTNLGVGGKQVALTGTINTPLLVNAPVLTGSLQTHANIFSSLTVNGSPLPTGLDVFRTQGASIAGLVGYTEGATGKPWSSSNIVGLYSTGTFRFWDCAVNSTTSSSTANSNSSFLAQACFNTSNGVLYNPAVINSGGTQFTVSGCSASTPVGGPSGGTFTLGANACNAVVTMNGATGLTAPTGWSCQAHDRTASTILLGGEVSSTATTATFAIPVTAGTSDVISFSCTGF